MAPSAGLVICLTVMASAAANMAPTMNTMDDLRPPPAADGELPFLDYEDPPQLSSLAENEEGLGSDESDGLKPAQEIHGTTRTSALEEASLNADGLPEEELGDAMLKLSGVAMTTVMEQPEAQDVQTVEQLGTLEPSKGHEDGHQYGTESDQDKASVEPQTHAPSLHPTQDTQNVQKLQNAESTEEETVGGSASAAGGSGSDAFASSPVSFSVKEGGSLILSCGRNLPPAGDLSAVSWLRPGGLLVSRGLPVSSDGRHQLLADGSLRLTSAEAQDDGMFTCRVTGAGGAVTQTGRRVHVLTRPAGGRQGDAPALQVVTEPAGGVSVVQPGQPATLACWLPGEPTATVTWTKQEGTLPYGESVLRGPRLEIGQVDRTHQGTYRCTVSTADNMTAVRSLQLQVNYAPQVTALEPVVYSGEDHQAVLRCQVFSHPPAEVHWRRPSGRPLRPGHHLTTQEGSTFSLTLLVETDDLDTYLCTASNVFGSGEAAVVLTGRPGRPEMTSPIHGSEPLSYTLSWRTPSVLPLMAYKLLYRQHVADASQPPRVQTAWREAILPLDDDDADDAGDDHRHQYVIGDLKPDTEYEAHVLAENRHGWSKPTAEFRFRTAPSSGEGTGGLRKNRLGVVDKTPTDFDALLAELRTALDSLLDSLGPVLGLTDGQWTTKAFEDDIDTLIKDIEAIEHGEVDVDGGLNQILQDIVKFLHDFGTNSSRNVQVETAMSKSALDVLLEEIKALIDQYLPIIAPLFGLADNQVNQIKDQVNKFVTDTEAIEHGNVDLVGGLVDMIKNVIEIIKSLGINLTAPTDNAGGDSASSVRVEAATLLFGTAISLMIRL